MKHLKLLGLVVVAAMAQTALLGAGSASATTIEITGVTQNGAITNTISQKPGTSSVIRDTFGFSSNTCTQFHTHGTTSSFTGAAALAPATSLEFANCTGSVTVHSPGVFRFEWTSGTNGTVSSSGAEITTASPFGTLNCKTGEGTHLGTVTGVASGQAEFDINANFSCSGISSRWEASTIITVPHNFAISQ
jgi:hypothetical protein